MAVRKGGSSSKVLSARPLTDQERVFIEEYMVDYNGKEAAVRAGVPSGKAAYAASVWLKDNRIRELLDVKVENRLKATGYTTQKIVEELYKISFSNIFDFCEVKGNTIFLKDSAEIPRELGAIVKSMEITKYGTKITLWNKLEAAALLMKMHGMLIDRVQVDVTVTPKGILDQLSLTSPEELQRQLSDGAVDVEFTPLDDASDARTNYGE